MITQIKFIGHGANSLIGGFAPGDTARVSAEMAKHLVDAGCAVYATSAPVIVEPTKPTKSKRG